MRRQRRPLDLNGIDPAGCVIQSFHDSEQGMVSPGCAVISGWFSSVCALCFGVQILAASVLLGLVWYYRSVAFHVLTSDGHCFERAALFQMAMDHVHPFEMEWNTSEVVYQNCLCTTMCWWAHPRSLEYRIQCWHACSETLRHSDHHFWIGTESFVPHLRQMFEDAHNRLRPSWILKGLPSRLDSLQYYWIAK